MKKKLKLVAALALTGILLCTAEPSVAAAGYYDFPAYFAADSYVSADGGFAWALSANYECVGSNQSVRVETAISLRNSSTGEFTRRIYRTKNAYGYDACAENEYNLTYPEQEIYYVSSNHRGTWNGMSMQDYTYASN